MASLTKDVWLGADNEFTLTLQERTLVSGVVDVSLASVTSMVLVIGDVLVHEQLAGDPNKEVDWQAAGGTGDVVFNLGALLKTNAIPTGIYPVELHVLDPVYPNGLVWFSLVNRELLIRVNSDNTP